MLHQSSHSALQVSVVPNVGPTYFAAIQASRPPRQCDAIQGYSQLPSPYTPAGGPQQQQQPQQGYSSAPRQATPQGPPQGPPQPPQHAAPQWAPPAAQSTPPSPSFSSASSLPPQQIPYHAPPPPQPDSTKTLAYQPGGSSGYGGGPPPAPTPPPERQHSQQYVPLQVCTISTTVNLVSLEVPIQITAPVCVSCSIQSAVVTVIAPLCMPCSSQCLRQQATISCIQLNVTQCETPCTACAVTEHVHMALHFTTVIVSMLSRHCEQQTSMARRCMCCDQMVSAMFCCDYSKQHRTCWTLRWYAGVISSTPLPASGGKPPSPLQPPRPFLQSGQKPLECSCITKCGKLYALMPAKESPSFDTHSYTVLSWRSTGGQQTKCNT